VSTVYVYLLRQRLADYALDRIGRLSSWRSHRARRILILLRHSVAPVFIYLSHYHSQGNQRAGRAEQQHAQMARRKSENDGRRKLKRSDPCIIFSNAKEDNGQLDCLGTLSAGSIHQSLNILTFKTLQSLEGVDAKV
jgi:hypothetical protein